MASLLDRLIDTGLIQFGSFHSHGRAYPVCFRLEMLLSYPTLLKETAESVSLLMPAGMQFDYGLCPFDSISLGSAVSLSAGLPLVYQAHAAGQPIDLIGAFDIGHPAVLITNVIDRQHFPEKLLHHARRLGLLIDQVICLIDCENGSLPSGMTVHAVMRLAEVVDELAMEEKIPPGQRDAVLRWIHHWE